MRKFGPLLLFFCVSSASAGVVLEMPEQASFFTAPAIRITGLPPLHAITIRATCIDTAGTTFTSSARFTPHVDGVVDTSRSIANGDYSGIDAMGLFWSLKGKGAFQLPLTGAIATTIDVLDSGGQTLISRNLERTIVPADVTITELKRPGSTVVGRYYEHAGGGERPGVLALTGSNGGVPDTIAAFLASNGYNVLALAYYRYDGVPENVIDLPLEYFRDGLRWLLARSGVDRRRLAIVGVSKGAEAALAVASHYPDVANAVVAFVPTHVIWEGVDARARFGGDARFEAPGRSSWSWEGKPLPFVHKSISPQRIANRPSPGFLDAYEPALEREIDPVAVIQVEKYHGGVFLAAAGDDIVWPSLRMAREIQRRLAQQHFKYPFELREYPFAGHYIAIPGTRVESFLGGTPSENARAGADAWTKAVAFLGASSQPARPRAAVEWKDVSDALGRAGSMQPGDVYKVSIPRTDLSVTADGVKIKPAFALGSWAAFKEMNGQTMAMGDLVLLEAEVNAVISALQAGGIEQSALHNHLNGETPSVMYLHFSGHGDAVKIARTLRQALALTKTPMSPASSPSPTVIQDIQTAVIDRILGYAGKDNGGVHQVSIPRAEMITEAGMEIPPSMGMATAINFQPTGNGRAAITGDFVMVASEVNPVIRALRAGRIDVTALHSHMLDETPRLFFMHFWANGEALTLARTLREALDKMNNSKPRETVLFMCPHGGAKSVIAASYFNRLALQRNLAVTAVAVASEDPYDAVPAPVAQFLKNDGLDVQSFKPRQVEEADLRAASMVVSVGCDLSKVNTRGVAIEQWDDVPLVSVDLPASAAAIRNHVEALIKEVGARP